MPDAYSEWLGIPDNFRPPTHYQLLGVAPSELDPTAIAAAADRRLEALRARDPGPRAADVLRIANEIIAARDVLLDPVSRQRYDALTPDAAAQWWQPEAAPPPAPTAPVEGWWQGESPDPSASPGTAGVPPAEASRPGEPGQVTATASASAGGTPAVPGGTPATKPTDWWKGAPGEVDVAPPPVVPPPPAPAVPTPPPPPVQLPPPSAAPVIRESTLALTVPESTGSPVKWMVLGLVAVGLACVAVVYGMRLTDKGDPETKQVAENKPKPPPDPVDPSDEDPDPVKPPPVKPKTGGTPAKTGNPETVKPDPPMPKPPEKDPPPSDDAVEPAEFRGHNGAVFGVAVSSTGKTIFSISDDMAVLHYAPKEPTKHGVIHKFGSPGLAVAFVGDGKTAVFCDGGSAVVYDIPARKSGAAFENPRGGIRSLAAAPDGSFVLTGATDGCVRWWDTKTKKLAHTLDVDEKATVSAVSIAPDGLWAAFGLSDGAVEVWNLKFRRETKRWKAHTKAITAVAVSPDGKHLVSTGDDGLANVWEPTGKLVKKLAGHDGPVTAAAWCSDGRVVTAGVDKTVRRWAPTGDGKPDWTEPVPAKIYSLALDARDRFAVVGRSDGKVQLLPLPRAATPGS